MQDGRRFGAPLPRSQESRQGNGRAQLEARDTLLTGDLDRAAQTVLGPGRLGWPFLGQQLALAAPVLRLGPALPVP